VKPRLTERSARKSLAELTPPPLFERVRGVKSKGKFVIKYNIKSQPSTKSGGGFPATIILRQVAGSRFIIKVLRRENSPKQLTFTICCVSCGLI